jgi:hypothetical protein
VTCNLLVSPGFNWYDRVGRLWKGAKALSRRNAFGDISQCLPDRIKDIPDDIFEKPDSTKTQILVDVIIECLIYECGDRERLRSDPLVRLLIPNAPGCYDFVIISAAGVVTEVIMIVFFVMLH